MGERGLTRQFSVCLIAAFSLAMGVTACGSSGEADKSSSPATPSNSAAAATTPSQTPSSAATTPTAATAADLKVCAAPDGLETRGQPFSGTFTYLMQNNGTGKETTNVELGNEIRALATIGAPAGLTDGSNAINDASIPVKQAIRILVDDAQRLLPNVAVGDVPSDEYLNLATSFGLAAAACKDAGYRVSWLVFTK